MQSLHRIQLYLQELQYQYLLHLAESEHKSISAIVRNIIDKFIHPDPLYKIIGLGHSGKKKAAIHHDRYLYKNPIP